MKIKGLCGNEKIVNSLLTCAVSGNLPHAVLLEGEKGLGKLALARLTAAALMCGGVGRPCMECRECKNVLGGTHPDVIEIDDIKINTVREVRTQAFISANQSDCKVFILKCAGEMLPPAQNTLLKVLEEPPRGVYFILCCERKNEMLQTIRSRCTVYSLQRANKGEIREYLNEQFPATDEDVIADAVEMCSGNISRAVGYIRGEADNRYIQISRDIVEALLSDSEWELMKAISALEKDRQSFSPVIDTLSEVCAQALSVRCGADTSDRICADCAERLAGVYTLNQLDNLYYTLRNFSDDGDKRLNHKLSITCLCLKLRQALQRQTTVRR